MGVSQNVAPNEIPFFIIRATMRLIIKWWCTSFSDHTQIVGYISNSIYRASQSAYVDRVWQFQPELNHVYHSFEALIYVYTIYLILFVQFIWFYIPKSLVLFLSFPFKPHITVDVHRPSHPSKLVTPTWAPKPATSHG